MSPSTPSTISVVGSCSSLFSFFSCAMRRDASTVIIEPVIMPISRVLLELDITFFLCLKEKNVTLTQSEVE